MTIPLVPVPAQVAKSGPGFEDDPFRVWMGTVTNSINTLNNLTPIVTPPGGIDTQVQFNDAGAFAGDAGLTYNKTSDVLSAGGLNTGIVNASSVSATGAVNAASVTATGAVNGATVGASGNITAGGSITATGNITTGPAGAIFEVNPYAATLSAVGGNASSLASISGVSGGTQGAAYLTFLRSGVFGAALGLDTDNTLRWGGWTYGAVSYRILHEGNAFTIDANGNLVQTAGNRNVKAGAFVGSYFFGGSFSGAANFGNGAAGVQSFGVNAGSTITAISCAVGQVFRILVIGNGPITLPASVKWALGSPTWSCFSHDGGTTVFASTTVF